MARMKERTRKPRAEWCRQNLPIPSETLGERVYMSEPIDETCWAYMKLLRSQAGSKKILSIDPYAEVYRFREGVFGILSESLDGMGDPWSYLIVGEEKAMLIDTGFGLGDLKGLCAELAPDRELIVVNTHGHMDHAYGNPQFDRVYCHEYDAAMLRSQGPDMWDYLFDEKDGKGIWAEFPREDLVGYRPYEIVGVPDGYTWRLGGDHEVELVHLGGHTAGQSGFLDKKNRVFFAGDDIISMRVGVTGSRPGMPHGECATVSELGRNMRRLEKRMSEFDHVFPGHFVTDLENSTVTAMAEACEAVARDPLGAASFAKGDRLFRYVEGLGTLAYRPESV